jgi:hypothetical protein
LVNEANVRFRKIASPWNMKTRVPLLLSCLIAAWQCAAQPVYEGAILLNNYDANRPIFFFDGAITQLAPYQTLVQVLGRPVGSSNEFQVLGSSGRDSIFYTGMGQDLGFFDGGYGVVPGVKQFDSAEVMFRAWRGGATWEKALTNHFAFVGQSAIFTNRTGQSSPFPGAPNPAPLVNAPSFTMYPFPQACRLVPFVGPRPLCMDVSANAQGLTFTWADLGTNYVYTLEFKPSLTATNWTPVPGSAWPSSTNQFTLPNPPAVPSFYRVKAQAMQ